VLSLPGEFRPGPPVAYDSSEKVAELVEIKSFPRTPQTNNEALFWEAAAALGERAAESRVWAGIHYRGDIVAGRQLAIAVADKVIERAMQDGAQ